MDREPPAATGGIIVRQRLLDILARRRPLTLVSAPAGYGKSVLVETWARATASSHTVVRLALDQDALDPRHFWAVAADRLRAGGVDVSGVRMWRGVGEDLRPLVHRIAAHEHDIVLVLDTGEFTLGPSVGAGLDWVSRRCRGKLSVVLLTRTDPPLALNQYRLDGAITDLRAAELAFTTDEVAELAELQGLDLTAADIALLHARTGGWPAGLTFALLALSDRADVARALEDFRGDTGNVAEYLLSEVLSKQTAESRRFLLWTCVADELDPELVEALTGEPCDQLALESMARANSFIERVPGRGDRFRYQLLFREFLRGRLAFEEPELVGELHRVTAEWLAQDGRVFSAIRHAALALEWPTATHLLVDRLGLVGLLVGWKSERLGTVLSELPDDAHGPAEAITRAALAISELDLATAEGHLAEAKMQVADGHASLAPTYALAVAVLAAIHASLGADSGAALGATLVAERALRMTPTRDLDALLELRAVIAGCKARVLFERGELEAAAQTLSDGVAAAETGRLDGVMTELKGMAAVVAAATGRLRLAAELAMQVLPGVGVPDEHVTGPGLEAAALALAWVRTDEAATPPPRELLDQAGRQRPGYDSRVLNAVLAVLRARLLESDGLSELALAELRGASEPFSRSDFAAPVTGWLADLLVVEEATSLLRLVRPEQAVSLLQGLEGPRQAAGELVLHRARVAAREDVTDAPLADDLPKGSTLAAQVDRWLLSAEESIERRAPARAAESLGRALRIAGPELLRRPFLEAGPDIQALLRRSSLAGRHTWLRTQSTTDSAGVAEVHLSARPAESRGVDPPRPVLVLPLTAKETEVLGYLGELLTTDEIAGTMFVSVNTVRSHVRSILRKLGASRRNEAVRRAWDLGLLPPEDPAASWLTR